jgi:hypothetical protein
MNPRKIVLLTILLTVFSSFAWAKKYEGLKVLGDYKTLKVVVESITKNSAGLTTEDARRTVKLRLLANGIKTTEDALSTHYLYVQVSILPITVGGRNVGYGLFLEFQLVKFSDDYKVPHKAVGVSFTPQQGPYSGIMITQKQNIQRDINHYLEMFLLDYLESNVK